MSLEWNSMRLGGPAHGIVTKTVHKILPGGGGGPGGGVGGVVGSLFDMKLALDMSEIKDDNIKFVILATILMYLWN